MLQFRAFSLVLVLAVIGPASAGTFPSQPVNHPFKAHGPTITTFDVPGGFGTTANSINDAGTITGYFRNSKNEFRAFIRESDGGIATFKVDNGTAAQTLNSEGAVIGSFANGHDYSDHGFVREISGTIKKINPAGVGTDSDGTEDYQTGTEPMAINASGEIVGYYADTLGVIHGFARSPNGAIKEFSSPEGGTAEGAGIYPLGLDKDGVIVGYTLNQNVRGFLRTADGIFATIIVPGTGKKPTSSTVPYCINDKGMIAGYYSDKESGPYQGFIRASNGLFTTFEVPGGGPLGAQGTEVFSINRSGAVTGYYVDANYAFHGFVRAANGNITTFDVPGAGTGAHQGTLAVSININGEIAGEYIDGSNQPHGFVRTP